MAGACESLVADRIFPTNQGIRGVRLYRWFPMHFIPELVPQFHASRVLWSDHGLPA